MLRIYLPQFLGEAKLANLLSYRVEYLHLSALNEIFVFSELPILVWTRILNGCLDFIDSCRRYQTTENEISVSVHELFSLKTQQRLMNYSHENNFDVNKAYNFNNILKISAKNILLSISEYLPNDDIVSTVMHGDFCFSNIFYDFCTGRIKTIDPRGMGLSGEASIYGDFHYDIAKLSHSILGLYDWIIAGYYEINVDQDNITFEIFSVDSCKVIQNLFIELIKRRYGLSVRNLYAMQIHLFLSMLPLHADNPHRQQAFIANVFRLYQLIQEL